MKEGLSPEYLWRRARERDPTLMLKKESIRPAFIEKDKKARLDFALRMLQKPPEFLHSIVFMDESSVPFIPLPERHIAVKGEDVLHTDRRVPHDKRQIVYIHYLLAVCYATGLVKMEILSYTKGYDARTQFYVSVCCCCCCCPHLNWADPVMQPIAGGVHDEAHAVLPCDPVNCMPQRSVPAGAVLPVQPH